MSKPSATKPSDGYKEAFQRAFPELVKELTEGGVGDPEISDGVQHLKDVSSRQI